MSSLLSMTRNTILKPIVFLAALLPLAQLIFRQLTTGLGANPVEVMTHRTGLTALILLFITLAITPLRKMTGLYWLIQYRRMLGLFAFFYACLHFLIYAVLDQSLDLASVTKDVYKRPFITVGFLAFILMIPLALPSTKGWIRRLGKRWQQLHRLIYVSAAAGALHFFWLVKKDKREPLIYAAVLALLLGYRAVNYFLSRKSLPATRTAAPAKVAEERG
jgi:methionine sulfoxide reductase heme-binding subunit